MQKKENQKNSSTMGSFLKKLRDIYLFIGTDKYGLSSYISIIKKEFDDKKTSYNKCISLSFSLIMVFLERSINEQKETVVLRENTDIKAYDNSSAFIDYGEVIAKIEDFFNYSFGSMLTLSDLAEKTNISPRHLNRILHQIYGFSFKQKLLETRIEKSKYLLLKSDHSIQKICEIIGYSSISSFSLLFNKYTGVSPGKYRRQFSEK